MGFQFMPSGLALKSPQNLAQYAEKLPQNTAPTVAQNNAQNANSTVIDLPWINIKVSLPHVDFGLDTLYGLDHEAYNSEISDELKF